jgi:hypothetical protein
MHVSGRLRSDYGRITTVVEDAAGHRLSGAEVALFTTCVKDAECLDQPLAGGPRRLFSEVMTGADGRADEPGLQTGKYQVCVYAYFAAPPSGRTRTGYADRCVQAAPMLDVRRGTHRTFVVRLRDAGVVTGRVTDVQGHPLADVRIHVTGAASDDFVDAEYETPATPRWDAWTDADGRYAIRSVPAGAATVCADPHYRSGPPSYQAQCLGSAPGTTTGGTTIGVAGRRVSRVGDLVLTVGSGGGAALKRTPTAARQRTSAAPPRRPKPGQWRGGPGALQPASARSIAAGLSTSSSASSAQPRTPDCGPWVAARICNSLVAIALASRYNVSRSPATNRS